MSKNNPLTQFCFSVDTKTCMEIFDHVNNGITITDKDSRVIYANPAFSKITGYSLDEFMNKNPGMLHSGKHDKQFYKAMWQDIINKGFWEGEIWNRRKSGEIYPELLTISSITKNDDPETLFYIAIFSDISFLKRDIDKTMHLAFYDPLTELPNRSSYLDHANKVFSVANTAHQQTMAVMYMDLNKFKQVNDTYGHCAGDELLKIVGKRLSAITRPTDFIARIGGDEFTAILSSKTTDLTVSKFAERIVESIEKPFLIQGHDVQLSISIGISFFPKNADTIEKLISQADNAMYEAKRTGVSIVYSDHINVQPIK